MGRMKFFSLFGDLTIKPAPGKKVIPAKDFESLLDAEKVLQKVDESVAAHHAEMIKESEKIKAQAAKRGWGGDSFRFSSTFLLPASFFGGPSPKRV